MVAGIKNKSAYLRKMALDGYIINQDFSEIKKIVYELNKIGVNINQMTKVANNYEDINLSELMAMKTEIQRIEGMLENWFETRPCLKNKTCKKGRNMVS